MPKEKKDKIVKKETIKKEKKPVPPKETEEEIELRCHILSFFHTLFVIQDADDIKRTLSKDVVLIDEISKNTVKIDYNVADYFSSFYKYINDTGILVETHIIDKSMLYVKFLKKSGGREYIEMEMETKMEKVVKRKETVDTLKICKIYMRKCDKKIFNGVSDKEYSFRGEPTVESTPSTLGGYDSEKDLEKEKGISYAVLFKFFKKWLVNEDMNELKKMITDDCVLIDREIIMNYEGRSDVISHLYTFITAFFSQEAVVLKYAILGNDLYIRMYKEKDDIHSDVLVASTIRGTQLSKLVMCVPERDAFMDPPKENDRIRDPVADTKILELGMNAVIKLFGHEKKLLSNVTDKNKESNDEKNKKPPKIVETKSDSESERPKKKKPVKKVVESSSDSESEKSKKKEIKKSIPKSKSKKTT